MVATFINRNFWTCTYQLFEIGYKDLLTPRFQQMIEDHNLEGKQFDTIMGPAKFCLFYCIITDDGPSIKRNITPMKSLGLEGVVFAAPLSEIVSVFPVT